VAAQGNPPIEVTFDNARDHNGRGVPCVLQGMGILYFALAANFWWLALCISVFEVQALRAFSTTSHSPSHVFCGA
jgi:hypothetical protein